MNTTNAPDTVQPPPATVRLRYFRRQNLNRGFHVPAGRTVDDGKKYKAQETPKANKADPVQPLLLPLLSHTQTQTPCYMEALIDQPRNVRLMIVEGTKPKERL